MKTINLYPGVFSIITFNICMPGYAHTYISHSSVALQYITGRNCTMLVPVMATTSISLSSIEGALKFYS